MPTETEIQLQNQIDQLKRQLNNLQQLFYKDNFSDLEIFRKKVQFNSDVKTIGKVGFFSKTPLAQQSAITKPTGGGTQDAEARTAIGLIIDLIKNFGFSA